MAGAEGKPRRDLTFKVFVALSLIVIFMYVFWYFVLPFFWGYEKLEISSYCPHYWVVNSRGEIKQLVIAFENIGTQDLTIEEMWVDEVLVDSTDWESRSGERTLESESGNTFYMVSKSFMFENGQDYNLTVVTARKNKFNFTLNINENNTKTEKVKISECYFYYWPPLSNNKVVGMQVESLGGTDVIIKKIWIDDASFDVSPRLWLHEFHSSSGIQISFQWKKGSTYTVTVKTVAESTYEITATAD